MRRLIHRIARKLEHLTREEVIDVPVTLFNLPSLSFNELFDSSSWTHWLNIRPSEIIRPRDMVLPLADLLTICALASDRQHKRILEIGTYTGETTLLMAKNSCEDCQIFTLDLPLDVIAPLDQSGYVPGSQFLGTEFSRKITQLYGRSESFDFSPYYGNIDLLFIDGDHRFEFVKQDTENALKMVRPGGRIVWDDYRWIPEHVGCRGVTDYLHSIQNHFDVRQIEGTRLATLLVQ